MNKEILKKTFVQFIIATLIFYILFVCHGLYRVHERYDAPLSLDTLQWVLKSYLNYIPYIAFGIFLVFILSHFLKAMTSRSFIEKLLNAVYISDDDDESDDYYNDLRGKIINPESEETEDATENPGQNGDSNKPAENQDVVELMLMNLKEIKGYYVMSKNQASKAFALAMMTSICGFLLIAAALLSFIFSKNTVTVVSAVSAIGGVISEFIAASSISVYKNATKQMATYYQGLHENEKLLLAANLGEKISAEKKDEMYLKLSEDILLGNVFNKKDDK